MPNRMLSDICGPYALDANGTHCAKGMTAKNERHNHQKRTSAVGAKLPPFEDHWSRDDHVQRSREAWDDVPNHESISTHGVTDSICG